LAAIISTDKYLNFILLQALSYNRTKLHRLQKMHRSTDGDAMKISGKFDVKLNALESTLEGKDGIGFGRMSIDKTFHGELEATAKGEMLSAMTSTHGSAGYVAIEQVTGRLSGKKGCFVLQPFGIMDEGQGRLVLEVIPDSGSGELCGLVGVMKINIEDGQHFYEFDYQLA